MIDPARCPSLMHLLAHVHEARQHTDQSFECQSCDPAIHGHLLGTYHLLAGMAADARGLIVEIGTDSGISSLCLAWGSLIRAGFKDDPQPVYSFDINPGRQAFARKLAAELGLAHVQYAGATSETIHQYVVPDVGLAFIDGHHSYASCLSDLENVAPLLNPRGRMLCHDYMEPDTGVPPHHNGVAHAVRDFLLDHPGEYEFAHLGHSIACLSLARESPRSVRVKPTGFEAMVGWGMA